MKMDIKINVTLDSETAKVTSLDIREDWKDNGIQIVMEGVHDPLTIADAAWEIAQELRYQVQVERG